MSIGLAACRDHGLPGDRENVNLVQDAETVIVLLPM